MASLLDFEADTPVEFCNLTVNEIFVYKVPPLRSASGHRAEDWDLATPLFTGCLKIFQTDLKIRVVVYSYTDQSAGADATNLQPSDNNLKQFAECPIEVKSGENILPFVDAVIDSSRYYVLRIKDPKSARKILLGIGFRERDAAFDFKNNLNDYVKFVNRMDLANQMTNMHLSGGPAGNTGAGKEDTSANEDDTSCWETSGTDAVSSGSLQSAATAGYASVGSGAGGQGKDAFDAASYCARVKPLEEGQKIKIALKGASTGAAKSRIINNTAAGGTGGGGDSVFKLKALAPPAPPPAPIIPHPSTTPTTTTSAAAGDADDEDWGEFS